jgi:hypothetical protein
MPNNQIQDEMGGACGTYGTEKKCIEGSVRKLKDGDNLENLAVMEKMGWV